MIVCMVWVPAVSTPVDASERRLKFVLLASVKSAFLRGLDVGRVF